MIKGRTVQKAVNIADELVSSCASVSAVSNTPLGQMVALAWPTQFTSYITGFKNEEEFSDSVALAISSQTDGGYYGNPETQTNMSQYEIFFKNFCDMLAPAITKHISFTRTYVRPAIDSMCEAVGQKMTNNRFKKASETVEIRPVEIPELLQDSGFLDGLAEYIDKPAIIPDHFLKLESKSGEDLIEALFTGHDRTDKLIAEWAVQLHPRFLEHVWMRFLSANNPSMEGSSIDNAGLPYSFEELGQSDIFTRVNVGIAIYLFARKLIIEAAAVPGMTWSQYEDIVVAYRNYAGAILAGNKKNLDNMLSSKTMVLNKDIGNKVLMVLGPVYREWTEAGGNLEVLMGLSVSPDYTDTVEQINLKAEKYLRLWELHESIWNASERDREIEYVRGFLSQVFDDSLKNLNPVEEEYIQQHPGYTATACNIARRIINNVTTRDIPRLGEVCIELVCRARFYYTSAYEIVTSMEATVADNPDINVREAALLAVFDYVADYLSAQMFIDK